MELPDTVSAERAVQGLNHRNIGNRYIEVFLSSDAEMAQATVTPTSPPQGNGPQRDANGPGSNGICRLRGLPFNTTAEILMQFFQARTPRSARLRCHSSHGN